MRPASRKSLSPPPNYQDRDLSSSEARNDVIQNEKQEQVSPSLYTRGVKVQDLADADKSTTPESLTRPARAVLMREKSHGRAEPRIMKNREDRAVPRMGELVAKDLAALDWNDAITAGTFLRADTQFVKAMTRELKGSLSELARDCLHRGLKPLKGIDANSGKEHDKAICNGLKAMIECFMNSALPERLLEIVREGDRKINEERIRRSEAVPGSADAYCDYAKKLKAIYVPAILLRTLIGELSKVILEKFPTLGSCQRKQADLLKSMMNRCFSGSSQATIKKMTDQGIGASYAKFITTFENCAELVQFYLTFHPSR